MPAAADRHATNGPPAAAVACGGVPATEVTNDGLLPAAIFDKLEDVLGHAAAVDIAENHKRAHKLCNGNWDVLVAAARKASLYGGKVGLVWKITPQIGRTGIPQEFTDEGWAAKVKADAEAAAKAALPPSQRNPVVYENERLAKERAKTDELATANPAPPFSWKMRQFVDLEEAETEEWIALPLSERLAIIARDRALVPPPSWMNRQKGTNDEKLFSWRRLSISKREAIIAADQGPCKPCVRARQLLESAEISRGDRAWAEGHLIACSKSPLEPAMRGELTRNREKARYAAREQLLAMDHAECTDQPVWVAKMTVAEEVSA